MKRIILDESGHDSLVLNVRKPQSIVKKKRALRRRSRSQSADETLVNNFLIFFFLVHTL